MCELPSVDHSLKYIAYMWFEGVSVTTVIPATARGEGRLRAAVHYVASAGSGGSGESAESADEFQIVHFPSVFTA